MRLEITRRAELAVRPMVVLGNTDTLLADLRRITNDYQPPTDGCASYVTCFADLEADTHLHIHKENNLLFPLVVRMETELSGASR